MLICPACHTENADGEQMCQQCHSSIAGLLEDARTVADLELPAPVRRVTRGDLHAGDVLCDRYEVLEKLGSGGMGCVFKVLDRHLDRQIALKTILPQQAADPEMLRRFKQEILLAREITHRNVIRIFDFGVDRDLCFITMELFAGEDLRSRLLKKGKFLPGEVMPIAVQMCEGLARAHAEGVVHRDLKPQNILINERDEIRILDFGLADLYDGPGSTQRKGLTGTPDYMSPEQARGELVDARSDLYSLGIVFYEMLTGTLPFKGDTVVSRLRARIEQRAPSLASTHPEIPALFSQVVDRCLEKDRPRRYASAGEILHDLQGSSLHSFSGHQISGHQISGHQISGIVEPTPQKSLSRLWMWIALPGAAAIAVSILAVWWLMRPKTDHLAQEASSTTNAPYIAVLPFKTSDASASAEAEGIRETIDSGLENVRGIHAIATSASEKADPSAPDAKVAQQLGATILVRGEVVNKDTQVVVKLNAYDSRKGVVVWSGEQRGDRSHLLSFENAVASNLLRGLQLETAKPAPNPTQDMQAYDLYLQGRQSLKEKRNDPAEAGRALQMFEQAVGRDPSFALAWSGVADASLNLYRLRHTGIDADRAVDAIRRALASSDSAEVHFAAGSVYTQTGRHEEAIAEIKRALQLQPESDDGYVRLGHTYLETGHTKEAIDALQTAVHLNPFYWYNHEQLARAYFREGMDGDALTEFRETAHLKPDSASAHLGIAGVLVRQGKWAESVPEYKKSIALRPAATAYTSLGSVFFYLGRYDEALPNFEKASQLQEDDPLVWGNLGSAYRQLGQKAKAGAAFRKGMSVAYERLSVNPKDAMILGYQALLHAYVGEMDEAQSFISRARSIDPSSNELMYNEGVVEAQAGPAHAQAAISSLRRAFASGYPAEEARHDPDLKPLENRPDFLALFSAPAK